MLDLQYHWQHVICFASVGKDCNICCSKLTVCQPTCPSVMPLTTALQFWQKWRGEWKTYSKYICIREAASTCLFKKTEWSRRGPAVNIFFYLANVSRYSTHCCLQAWLCVWAEHLPSVHIMLRTFLILQISGVRLSCEAAPWVLRTQPSCSEEKKISTARSKFLGVPVSKIRLEDTTQGSGLHKKRKADKKAHCGKDVWRLCELCGTTTHKNEALDNAARSMNSIPLCYTLPCASLWPVPHYLTEIKLFIPVLQFYICKIHLSKSF